MVDTAECIGSGGAPGGVGFAAGGSASRTEPALCARHRRSYCPGQLRGSVANRRFARSHPADANPEQAEVPDAYDTVNQILALYPLAMWPVDFGVFRYQEQTRALFAQPLTDLPVQGQLRRYGSAAPPDVPGPAASSRDALDIPDPTLAQREILFAAHAPVWEIDTVTAADRPGAPYWTADGLPTVDPVQPVVDRYFSYSRWRGEPVWQLNYLLWFAARPKTGAFPTCWAGRWTGCSGG